MQSLDEFYIKNKWALYTRQDKKKKRNKTTVASFESSILSMIIYNVILKVRPT